jgi:hypothetical protein
MKKQEFSYKYICNVLKGSNLSIITVPLNDSKSAYSHLIYDYKIKDILFVLRRIYELNFFNERYIMKRHCDKDSLNYILYSQTNFYPVAIMDADSFDLEVGLSKDLSTSKHLPIFQDIFIILDECMNNLEIRKHELESEHKELDNTYNRIMKSNHGVVELYNIYKDKLNQTCFCNLKEKKKWKEALMNLAESDDKKSVVVGELLNITKKLRDNIILQKNCTEEYLCLFNCKEYLTQYLSNFHQFYIDKLSCFNKTTMEAIYEQQEKVNNYHRNNNGREIING